MGKSSAVFFTAVVYFDRIGIGGNGMLGRGKLWKAGYKRLKKAKPYASGWYMAIWSALGRELEYYDKGNDSWGDGHGNWHYAFPQYWRPAYDYEVSNFDRSRVDLLPIDLGV